MGESGGSVERAPSDAEVCDNSARSRMAEEHKGVARVTLKASPALPATI
jgi:hypothetical protein